MQRIIPGAAAEDPQQHYNNHKSSSSPGPTGPFLNPQTLKKVLYESV
jgi:hypothetical protein